MEVSVPNRISVGAAFGPEQFVQIPCGVFASQLVDFSLPDRPQWPGDISLATKYSRKPPPSGSNLGYEIIEGFALNALGAIEKFFSGQGRCLRAWRSGPVDRQPPQPKPTPCRPSSRIAGNLGHKRALGHTYSTAVGSAELCVIYGARGKIRTRTGLLPKGV